MIRGVCPGCGSVEMPIRDGKYVPHLIILDEPDPDGSVLALCDGSELPMRVCRECGCTDEDCSGCIRRTGGPCSWVEDDLCSACVDKRTAREMAFDASAARGDRADDVIVRLPSTGGILAEELRLPRALVDDVSAGPSLAALIEANSVKDLSAVAEILGLTTEDPISMGCLVAAGPPSTIDPALVHDWSRRTEFTPEGIVLHDKEGDYISGKGYEGVFQFAVGEFNDPNDLLHGIAEQLDDQELKAMAEAGEGAWVSAMHSEVLDYQQRPPEETPEERTERARLWREREDYQRRRDERRGR